MIVSSEKKLKQGKFSHCTTRFLISNLILPKYFYFAALLQFKTTSNDKKRKLDDETSLDEAKCRKLSFDNLGNQNQQPVDNKKVPNRVFLQTKDSIE